MPTLVPVEERKPRLVPADPEQDKRIREAVFYSQQLGIAPDKAYDLTPQLNQEIFKKESLNLQPGKLFFDAFMQSLADKPAMMLKGVTAYTPGKAAGIDPLLDRTSLYLESLKDPKITERVQTAAQGKLWPVGDERRWWQVELQYVPEVINAWAANVGDQIPIMLITLAGRTAGNALGKSASALAGGGAAIATAGPDPSDVATAPAVMAVTREVIKHLGGAAPLVAMEAGGFLDEATKHEIDADIAEKYAKMYGLGSGAIEYAQWLWVLGRYKKIGKETQEKILTTVLKEIGGTAFEGVEEMSQGGVQRWLLGKAVAEMKERYPEYDKEPPKITEGMTREGIIGAGVAAITRLPGHGMSLADGAVARMREVKPEMKKFLGEPSTQELEQVAAQKVEKAPVVPVAGQTAEMATNAPSEPSAKITPISEPKTGGEIPEVIEQVPVEEEETPEEAKEAKTKLAEEAAQEIEPELWIGNVTQGMKRRMSETGQFSEEDVKGFTEKGWPTNRTKVKMSRGEAEMYLDWLERDLLKRLDENRINAYHDMAIANADWGDVKTLRKALGLSQAQRPWKIIAEQGRGDVVRNQGEITNLKQETRGLRKQFLTLGLKEREQGLTAEEETKRNQLESDILEKQRLIRQMEMAEAKAVKVIKDTRSSIWGAVEPSRLQESKMTVQEVLRAVMKRSARYAKMAYAGGRKELRAQLRAKARAKARLNKALKAIKQKVPMTVDFFYREAIDALRGNIDLKFRSERNQAKRKATLEFMNRVPESDRDIPLKVMEHVSKTPLNDLTIEEIENVASEVQKLIQQGKLKYRLKQKPKLEQKKADIENLFKSVEDAKPMKVQNGPKVLSTEEGLVKTAFDKAKFWTWTPSRLFDMLDGGKGTFSGLWHRIFYDGVKEAKRAAKNAMRNTERAFSNTRKQLELSLWDLAKSRRIMVDGKEFKLTTQEIMGVYMSSLNPLNRLHLIYGNGFTEKGIADVVKAITKEEKSLADWILNWYEQNQPKLRRAVIEQENRDMGKEEFYSPILPKDATWKNLQEEIRMAVDQRQQLRAHNVAHGFTLDRKDVPEWMRGEIRLDAVNIFVGQVQKQERYIHLGPHIRRMNKLRGNTKLRKIISDRFGVEMLKMIDGYVGSVANPYIYRQYSLPERISARLRQNTAIAYLAFNLTTIIKQPAAMLFYLPDAGPSHLLASAMEFAQNPLKMMEKVRSLDPEVSELSMEREFEELKGGTNANVIRKAVTDTGLEGIYFLDQVARTIGWNAVYEKAKSDGKSEAEAIRMAQDATLRTQNAAEAEDIPALYRTSEFLNWFTLFTNQVNKMWNMATYDVPSYFQNQNYAAGVLGIMALSINALIMWMIVNRKWPEDPAELAEAIGEQALELVPLVGKPILDGIDGWETDVPIFTPAKAIGKAIRPVKEGIATGKWDLSRSDTKAIAEGISIAMGIPYTSIKRIVQAVEEKQPTALIGARRPQNRRRGGF